MNHTTFVAFFLAFGSVAVYSAKISPTPSTSPKVSPSPDCFPANAKVELDNGAFIRMDQLKIGDRVAVGKGKFSEVFIFTHQNKLARRTFLRFHTSSLRDITVTSGHYLRVGNQLKAAAVVSIGDILTLESGEQTTIVGLSKVDDIGLFNPQTLHGDIVINGIVASTYTTAVHAKIAHSALALLRFVVARFGSVLDFHNDIAVFIAKALGIAGEYVVAA